MAEIHEQLRNDCIVIGRLELCHVLLMNDANYPWCILVPDREDIREVYQLDKKDRLLLMEESAALGQSLMQIFTGDKLNVAALGNMVPQLHIHHIVRYRDDPAWPMPVWGRLAAKPYSSAAKNNMIEKIRAAHDIL